MKTFVTFAVVVCVTLQCSLKVEGHGYLLDPINRASLWKVDPSAPVDWDDNQLYCGSFGTHWNTNKGKCGFCGDDYRDPVPRAHENGGKYGTGKIVQTYKRGADMKVTVQLDTNHAGYFLFSLCSLPSSNALETEDCFQNVTLANGEPVYKLPDRNNGKIAVTLRAPEVTCNHCVLRWTYVTANSWGNCPGGGGAMGCGPQEWFRSCSDIAITGSMYDEDQ